MARRPHHKQQRGLSRLCLAMLLVLGGAVALRPGDQAQGQGNAPSIGADKGTGPKTADKAADAVASPMDQPLAWIHEAKRNFTAVKDYACTLQKREAVGGKTPEDHIISFKSRTQPFSVYMRWLAPAQFSGQEVAYIHGKNNNKMRVQSKLLLQKVVGFVSIDVNDPRVLEHSRHTILEAGIGNLIEHTIKLWEVEKQIGKTQVKTGEYNYNNRRCIRVEMTRSERHKEYYAYRSVIYLDKESKIPIRVENYDWPRSGGSSTGELMEMFAFVDLRFNVGLTERDFAK